MLRRSCTAVRLHYVSTDALQTSGAALTLRAARARPCQGAGAWCRGQRWPSFGLHGQSVRWASAASKEAASESKAENGAKVEGSAATSSAAPSTDAKEDKAAKASFRQLWSVLSPERTRLQLAVGALCASSSVTLSYPYLVGRLVDLFGGQDGGLAFVMEHAYACGGIVLFGGLATFCRLYLIETAIERIGFRLRREFFRSLMLRDVEFFDRHKTGELINRMSNDITVTSRVLIDASAGLRSSLTAIVGTCMVVHIAPTEMIANLLSPVAAIILAGAAYGRLVRHIATEKQTRLASCVQHAEERLAGIRTVRAFNAEPRELKSFEGLLNNVYDIGRKNALAQAGFSAIIVSGGGLVLLSIVYNCGVLVSTGVVSMGSTVSLGMYSLMAGSAYTGLATSYGDIQKSLGSCQQVLEILNAKPGATTTLTPITSLDEGERQPVSVSFENVSFAYPARPDAPVLQGLDLDIPAGARVAVLGRSGSGKSTIAALLAALYEPANGRVLMDGVDIASDPSQAVWARSQLGIISQEPTLFALTVRDNVAYGLPGEDSKVDDAGEEALDSAIRVAYVNEFAERLPEGLNTPAGERGQALSGGQKQRVCIARALVRQPRMLVFDEATSALDLRSEELIHSALKEILASGECTCLVITHRLSALQWVDQVAVMDEGRVVQYGARDEVLANPCEVLQAILRSNDELAAAAPELEASTSTV